MINFHLEKLRITFLYFINDKNCIDKIIKKFIINQILIESKTEL